MVWGETPDIHFKWLLATLDRLFESGLLVSAHQTVIFRKEIKWCRQLVSGQKVNHDPERTEGLSQLPRPESAVQIMQFKP